MTSLERKRILRARGLTFAGIGLTCLSFLAAMYCFPSGDENVRGGYSFGRHFLSAMGKTRVGTVDNTVSCVLFNGTLVLVGIILAVFWDARALYLARAAQATALRACGVAMALSLAGIGLTPYDHFPHAHDRLTQATLLFGVLSFGLCLVWTRHGFESAGSKLGWLLFLMAAGAAQVVFVTLTSRGILPSRPALPLMQKLFVFMLMSWAGWQAWLFDRTRLSQASRKDF